jgi:hypothetical protein
VRDNKYVQQGWETIDGTTVAVQRLILLIGVFGLGGLDMSLALADVYYRYLWS